MGISRIYTVRNFRRLGIASKLLDTACLDFIYGYEIPKSLVAWSQPSYSGSKLLISWNSEQEFLTFKKKKNFAAAANNGNDDPKSNNNNNKLNQVKDINNNNNSRHLVLTYLESDALTKASKK